MGVFPASFFIVYPFPPFPFLYPFLFRLLHSPFPFLFPPSPFPLSYFLPSFFCFSLFPISTPETQPGSLRERCEVPQWVRAPAAKRFLAKFKSKSAYSHHMGTGAIYNSCFRRFVMDKISLLMMARNRKRYRNAVC